MKIVWVFPQRLRCGIAMYADRYVKTLREHAEIICLDPRDFCRSRAIREQLDTFDIVHLHYEPSLFQQGRRDCYGPSVRSLDVPAVVTLHEVYKEFPGVFPRSLVRGNGPIGWLKRLVYDIRHQSRTAYHRNLRHSFYAERVVVHHQYQKRILIEQGLRHDRIEVIPYAVYTATTEPQKASPDPGILRIGATGFINPNYDYRLLFETLANLTVPWIFTWIGGVRRDEDQALLSELDKEIRSRGWSDRCSFTGWITLQERDLLLGSLDVCLALFTNRSSSESLATAVGLGVPVIASAIPLTEEMAEEGALMLAPAEGATGIARLLDRAAADRGILAGIVARQEQYRRAHDPVVIADRLMDFYRSIVAQ